MRVTVTNRTSQLVVLPAPINKKLAGGTTTNYDNVDPQEMANNLTSWDNMVNASQISYITSNDPNVPDNVEGNVLGTIKAGATTHAGADTQSVVFDEAFPDTNYLVALGPDTASMDPIWASKATTGFDVTSAAAGVVNWVAVRVA